MTDRGRERLLSTARDPVFTCRRHLLTARPVRLSARRAPGPAQLGRLLVQLLTLDRPNMVAGVVLWALDSTDAVRCASPGKYRVKSIDRNVTAGWAWTGAVLEADLDRRVGGILGQSAVGLLHVRASAEAFVPPLYHKQAAHRLADSFGGEFGHTSVPKIDRMRDEKAARRPARHFN